MVLCTLKPGLTTDDGIRFIANMSNSLSSRFVMGDDYDYEIKLDPVHVQVLKFNFVPTQAKKAFRIIMLKNSHNLFRETKIVLVKSKRCDSYGPIW
jgi:hypothetical protein